MLVGCWDDCAVAVADTLMQTDFESGLGLVLGFDFGFFGQEMGPGSAINQSGPVRPTGYLYLGIWYLNLYLGIRICICICGCRLPS